MSVAPETSAGAMKVHITVYPSGWAVCWLTRVIPTPNGPRARYVSRWSVQVDGPGALEDVQKLVRTAIDGYHP